MKNISMLIPLVQYQMATVLFAIFCNIQAKNIKNNPQYSSN